MISVIIPTFNRKNLLMRSLNSVLNQTIWDIEVIIVDDCSEDGTCECFDDYSDKRVKYIRLEERSGACTARNVGIDHAQGEYIAFQDSDDVWYPDKLEKQLNYLIAVDADIVFCDVERFINGVKAEPFITRIKRGRITYEDLIPSNVMSTQTVLGKAACFADKRFNPQMKRVQDWELAFRLIEEYNIYFLDEILVTAYVQGDSITNNYAAAFESALYVYERYIQNHITPTIDLTIFLMREGYQYLNSEMESMRVKYEAMRIERDETARKLDSANAALIQMKSSTSWKITYPIRRFVDIIRSITKQ